ncbi:hypothetical protein Ahy_B06g083915 [Arachis hypogaea]|uniref:Aminotransferase-like plant mobile domain-containing protein n=1 Tax=Arachis hypogaea TaxID=3818 RepID=A0A444YQT0_ARAHY|nr:hypothetical protein Ahy_B06g083915 [Arachis hypogaea]
MGDNPDRLYHLDGVAHIASVVNEEELLGVLPPADCINKFTVRCSWMQETFGQIPDGADDATIQRYARAYIMMLLGTQLFGDKSGTRLHIRWLPCMYRVANRNIVKLAGPLQLLQSWILWRFPGFRPAGYDIVHWPLASRWSGYNPTASERGPRVAHWRLRIDLLQAGDVTWMPYSTPEVVQDVHPEILEPCHMALWRSVTSLIYFAVIEWHQDGRGGDRWFPYTLQFWHLHWDSRADHVLRFDVVPNPGPSHDFLDWWA